MEEQNQVPVDPKVEPQEEKALPDPMDRKELPEHTASSAKAQRPVIVKNGLLSNPFVGTMFLIAFFLVSFALGTYVERNEKLATALGSNAVAAGNQVAGAGTQQEVGLQDGQKVDQDIKIDSARVKGNPNAKVTLIEYSDFECPFCASFYTNSYKQIVQKYVDSGQVKIAFKDFPLSFHPMAQASAEASRCAAEQGKFWEMHDKMFENQEELSKDNYKKWGAELGLNTQQFNACVDTEKYKQAVLDEMNEGAALGVQGTPSFVINGVALVGAQPMAAFEKIIDEALK